MKRMLNHDSRKEREKCGLRPRRLWQGMALAAAGAALLLSGCGTEKGGGSVSEDVALPGAVSFAGSLERPEPESPASEEPKKSGAEDHEALWSEVSLPTLEEWAASAAERSDPGDAKEQAGEFLEDVQGLMDRLNRIREEGRAGSAEA